MSRLNKLALCLLYIMLYCISLNHKATATDTYIKSTSYYRSHDRNGSVFQDTQISSTRIQNNSPSNIDREAIYRELLASGIVEKRDTDPGKNDNNTSQLYSVIIAQIKARVHTEIVSKISASILQKVKGNISVKGYIGSIAVVVKKAQIEAIQTAAVSGLQTRISKTVEKSVDKLISQSLGSKLSTFPVKPSSITSSSQLKKTLMNAETIVRSQIRTTLPEIQKTVEACVNSHLKAHIKNLKLDIPGLLDISISANVDITSSVKTVVQTVYKTYADVSLSVVVQSYIAGIQKAVKNSSRSSGK